MSMPGYVEKSLEKLQHKLKRVLQYYLHEHNLHIRSQKGTKKYTKNEDNPPFISKKTQHG